jgi:hypothetical protein
MNLGINRHAWLCTLLMGAVTALANAQDSDHAAILRLQDSTKLVCDTAAERQQIIELKADLKASNEKQDAEIKALSQRIHMEEAHH